MSEGAIDAPGRVQPEEAGGAEPRPFPVDGDDDPAAPRRDQLAEGVTADESLDPAAVAEARVEATVRQQPRRAGEDADRAGEDDIAVGFDQPGEAEGLGAAGSSPWLARGGRSPARDGRRGPIAEDRHRMVRACRSPRRRHRARVRLPRDRGPRESAPGRPCRSACRAVRRPGRRRVAPGCWRSPPQATARPAPSGTTMPWARVPVAKAPSAKRCCLPAASNLRRNAPGQSGPVRLVRGEREPTVGALEETGRLK